MRRAFHLIYTLLALNFLIPVVFYAVDPGGTLAQFTELNQLLGGTGYTFSEDSVLWRVLAIANVSTLGFCCVLLQVDLQKYYPVLLPLVFLKSMAALGFLVAFIVEGYPAFLAASLFDSLTVGAMLFFATRAHAELAR
ncbi:MAG: hypothetical protein IT384_25260 [Deltaproteobacteria bacterium]|nr:hypothetical protein [Deltaproteobacteria bacterium]